MLSLMKLTTSRSLLLIFAALLASQLQLGAAYTAFCPTLKARWVLVSTGSSQHRLHAATQAMNSHRTTHGIQMPFATTSRRNSMKMLVETSGGMEELQELTEKADTSNPLAKQLRKSPSFFKLAAYASIPISAALGFGLVPSRRFAAHTVGAVLTGIAGAVGKSRLDALTESNAKPAVAQAILDHGLENIATTKAAVQSVKETFGLADEDFALICTQVYAAYLLGMVKYLPTAKTSELKELENLRAVLQMDNMQVGEAHMMAATDWYRQTAQFTPDEELNDVGHPDRQAIDKLLFLTERALRQGGETDEAFRFEMTRVSKALRVPSLAAAMERVADTVEPFYQRALKSTRSKLGTQQVSAAMLERARKTLGITDATAHDLHVAAFNAEVRSLLGLPERVTDSAEDDDDDDDDEDDNEDKQASDAKAAMPDASSVKFPEGSIERLEQLREILLLSETDASYEIASEATPLFQATAMAAMKDVLSSSITPDAAWEIIRVRREELLLKDEASKDLLSSMVMQALGGKLEETNKFAKVNNEAAAYEHILEALDAKKALIAILTKSGWDEFDHFDETFCNPWNKQSANGFLSTEERTKLYRSFLTRSVLKGPEGKLTDEMYARIMEVKGLLGMSDQQAEIQARGAFGPELQSVLRRAMTEIVEDFTPELVENMRKDVEDVMSTYRLSEDYLRESGASFYSKAVELVSEKAPGGVPTNELSEALDSLRDLYKLRKEETYAAHLEYFGAVYKKSVLEAMGSTGVIRPEFRGGLDDLRQRLGVSEESCQKLFLEAVEEKMIPMVEWIGSEMERTLLTQEQRSRRKGKDLGEDVFQSGKSASGVLGLGAEVNIMSDIMNLIDFYTENDIAEEREVRREVVERSAPSAEAGGEDQVVTEEVPVFETVYPVTALGSNAIDPEMAELLFRQFVVGGFTSQGPQAARYEASRDVFAGILGLSKEKRKEVIDNIAGTVYDNFVSNAMKTKGIMDQQDMMFLANLQTKLGLSPQDGEKLLVQSQRKILADEINAIMDSPSPSSIKAFREKCNMMGMDITEDVGVSKQRLTRMFESEIIPGLKSGEITVENSAVLAEIQESLGLDPEECEAMFENVLVRLAKNAMDIIKGELLRGREDNTVHLIKEIVRYAAFTEGDLGLEVDEATAYKVMNIYDAFDFSGASRDIVDANKELLRAVLGR